jgi:hypothetical protein
MTLNIAKLHELLLSDFLHEPKWEKGLNIHLADPECFAEVLEAFIQNPKFPNGATQIYRDETILGCFGDKAGASYASDPARLAAVKADNKLIGTLGVATEQIIGRFYRWVIQENIAAQIGLELPS